MATERDQAIRERAYQLWVEGGRQHGADQQDWLKAEGEQASEPVPKDKAATAKAPAAAKAAKRTAGPKPKAALKGTAPRKDPASSAKARANRSPRPASPDLEPGR